MEPNTTLRLDRLRLSNFRCFTECDLELDPSLTVIVAENAQGKTALLNAITIALDVFVAAIGDGEDCHGFERSDIHLIQYPEKKMVLAPMVSFAAEGMVDGEAVRWERSLPAIPLRARSSTKDTRAMRSAAEQFRGRISLDVEENNHVTLPSVAFYGTGRLWDEHRLTKGKRWQPTAKPARLSAYLDCLSPSSSFKTFATWYENLANSLRSSTSKAYGPDGRPEQLLAAVRKAVAAVLEPTGWTLIDWEFPPVDPNGVSQGGGHLVVEHSARGRLPLAWLSDGVRNMVALVGDLAHRCARLNPHLGEDAARLTPGILLIDEVDMHLHPSWQQLVVCLLDAAFPLMQKVYTTHSPQVLTTVKSENIRILSQTASGEWTAEEPEEQTKGVESAAALAGVMDVDPIPPVQEARNLSRYQQLIQLQLYGSEEGKKLRADLEQHFGPRHPLILDCDRLIRLEQFKAKLPIKSSKPIE